MITGNLKHYLDILTLIDKEIDTISAKATHIELISVSRSICDELNKVVNVSNLDKRLLEYLSFDTVSIRKIIEIIKTANLSKLKLQNLDLGLINPQSKIKEIEDSLKAIENNEIKLGRSEISMRFELYFNPEFERILLFFNGDERQILQIKKLVLEKLLFVSDDNIMRLWITLKEQFGENQIASGFEPDDLIMGKNFFNLKDTTEAREKLADYVVRIRPQLIKSQLPNRRISYPSSFTILGLTHIVSIKNHSTFQKITEDDLSLLRNLSRLCYLWENNLRQNNKLLLNLLGLTEQSYVFAGEERRDFEKEIMKNSCINSERIILHLLRKVIAYTSLYATGNSPVERALYNYKLGLEVLAPSNLTEYRDYKGQEEKLQRLLCKFLIENNIRAFGTKFGRSQIDLLCSDGVESYVVETKVYSNGLTAKAINTNLVQLQSYMTQTNPTPRGILFIYNLTNTVICSQNKWIRGRYWILPINLGSLSPSKRRESIEIREGLGRELLDCSVIKIA